MDFLAVWLTGCLGQVRRITVPEPQIWRPTRLETISGDTGVQGW